MGRLALREALEEAHLEGEALRAVPFISATTVGGMDRREAYHAQEADCEGVFAEIELKCIQGVGEGKVKQPYAKEFVDLIKTYCEENEIERNVDMRVRTVANKSLQKISIIQSIDRQVALDDIALAKGLDFDARHFHFRPSESHAQGFPVDDGVQRHGLLNIDVEGT